MPIRDENLVVPLNPRTADLLAALMRVAEKTASATVDVVQCQSPRYRGYDFRISGVSGRDAEHLEETKESVEGIPGQPLLELQVRGYVLGEEGMHKVLNYRLAQQRVLYEGRGRLGKWWMRTTNNLGRFVLDLAAGIAGVWAAADMIRMLVEALK